MGPAPLVGKLLHDVHNPRHIQDRFTPRACYVDSYFIALAARGAGVIEAPDRRAASALHIRTGRMRQPLPSRQQGRSVVTVSASGFRRAKRLASGRVLVTCAVLGTLALGLSACGHKKQRPQLDLAASKVTTIGVNAYLWRASLETLSFMPLLQTDSNGGVIVTDWYANPKNPGERVKVTVSILDQDLRADALRVAASRQVSQNGQWVDAPVQAATVQKLEDVILTRARDLRRQTIKG